MNLSLQKLFPSYCTIRPAAKVSSPQLHKFNFSLKIYYIAGGDFYFFLTFAFKNQSQHFDMEYLSTLMGAILNIPAITGGSTTCASHICPGATTCEDICLAAIIGLIVIICLWIIGHYVSKSIASVQQIKIQEQKSRQDHELAKLDKEAEIRMAADVFHDQQTVKQREWISEADRIKYEEERLMLSLKKAEVNHEISKLASGNAKEKNDSTHEAGSLS